MLKDNLNSYKRLMKYSLGKQFSKSNLKGRGSLACCVGNLLGSAATFLWLLGTIAGTTAAPLDPNHGPKTDSCVPPPAGLASCWSTENPAIYLVSGATASPSGGVSYTNGLVGQAFQFDGSCSLAVPASPSLNIGTGSGITIELWAKLNWSGVGMPVVEWDAPNIEGVSLWVDAGPGCW